MTEQISIMLDSEDKKNFEEFTGMKFVDGMKLLMDNIKYGGQLGLDPFWSEENQKCLQKSIRELEEGKNVVKFTAEEWEKFVNAQELQWQSLWRVPLLANEWQKDVETDK